MTARYGRGRIDLGVRAAGCALVCGGAGAALLLRSLTLAHPGRAGLLQLLLAAILFLCGSIGSALLFTGAGIFDRIEVASRWRNTPYFPARRPVEPQRMAMEEIPEHA